MIIILIILPIGIITLINRNFDKIHSKKTQKKFGILYEDLSIESKA